TKTGDAGETALGNGARVAKHSLRVQAVERAINAAERRVEDALELDAAALAEYGWSEIVNQILQAAGELYDQRKKRYLGPDGLVVKELDAMLEKTAEPAPKGAWLGILMQLPQGSKALFDRRTHRKVVQRTRRFTLIYYAAGLLDGRSQQEVADAALKHMQAALNAIQITWGLAEFGRLGNARPVDLDPAARSALLERLGEPADSPAAAQPLAAFPVEQRSEIINELGRRVMSGVYRQLLLSVITELWVDYLTQMEALRVSIGLEAYAQRDPLVQYKSRAGELYQNLQNTIRTGVVTRMFTYRARDLSQVQAAVARDEDEPQLQPPAAPAGLDSGEVEAETLAPAGAAPDEPDAAAKKRKRRRK
ncbi:MAG: hypothetical protein ACKOC5_11600, partial [Chloroflexota bacterium]